MAKTLSDVTLSDLLPPSIAGDEQVSAAASALDPHLQKVAKLAVGLPFMSALETLDESWCDALAWQWHVDLYDTSYSDDSKRLIVQNALPWHRYKGTLAAVNEAVRNIYDDVEVQEWFDYGGDPYRFKVTVDFDAFPDTASVARIYRDINNSKNVRSQLDGLQFVSNKDITKHRAAALYATRIITIERQVSFESVSIEQTLLYTGGYVRAVYAVRPGVQLGKTVYRAAAASLLRTVTIQKKER